MRRLMFAITCLAVVVLNSYSATADVLVFSDDFEGNDFEEKWLHSAENIGVVNGRVEATANGRGIRTKESFSGNLRIEYDFGKVGSKDNSCWDTHVELYGVDGSGVVLFDHNGIDGAGIDMKSPICLSDTDIASTPETGINSGRAVLTYADSKISFSFTNDAGTVLDAGTVDAGEFENAQVRIMLAAFSDSIRWIDNVKVYSTVPEPSTITLFATFGLIGILVAWRKRKRT